MYFPSQRLLNFCVFALIIANILLGLADFQVIRDYASTPRAILTHLAPAVPANLPVGSGPDSSTTEVEQDVGNSVFISENPGTEMPTNAASTFPASAAPPVTTAYTQP